MKFQQKNMLSKNYYIIATFVVVFIIIILIITTTKKSNSNNNNNTTGGVFDNVLIWQSDYMTYSGLKTIQAITNSDITLITNLCNIDCYTESTDTDNVLTNNQEFDYPSDTVTKSGYALNKNLISSKCEHRFASVYTAVSILKYMPINNPVLKSHSVLNRLILSYRDYTRLSDNKTITIVFIANGDENNAPNIHDYLQAVADILSYVNKTISNDMIIVMETNLHGYEKIFNSVFKDSLDKFVLPPDLYKLPIANNKSGLYSNCGIIVSKSSYSGMDYSLDLPPIASSNTFQLSVNLKINDSSINCNNDKINPLLELMKKNVGSRTRFIDNDGDYNVGYVPVPDNVIDRPKEKTTFSYFQNKAYKFAK